ncbi:MAG: hypothetical protein H0V17_25285, partial [Deltaproteobacteria bacterium]|nr:hypothetical protein [Deltaproteobacteria bacterium]
STNGRHIATVDSGNRAVLWDLVAGRGRMFADNVVHIALDLDGSRIVTSRTIGDDPMRDVQIWDVATMQPTKLGEMIPTVMQFGPGDRLAIATSRHSIQLFERGVERQLTLPKQQIYRTLLFSADGKTLYAGTDNWVVEAYDLTTNTTRTLRGHMGTIVALALDSTGTRLFSASADNTVRVWRLEDGSSTILRGHTGLVTSLEVADDNTLVTAAQDRTARIWDVPSATYRLLSGHEDRALFAAPVAGGQRIVVVDRFRQIALYPDNLPFDERLLRVWFDAATNLTKQE